MQRSLSTQALVVHRWFYTGFTDKIFYTFALLRRQIFCAHMHFTHRHALLSAEAFTRRCFCTHFTKKNKSRFFLYRKLLHAEDFTRRCFYNEWSFKRFTHKWITPTHLYTLTHRCVCTRFLHQNFNTQAFLHIENFYAQKPLHTGALTQKWFYTHFAHKRFCTGRLLHTEAFTNMRFYTECTRKNFYAPAF